MKLLGLLSVKLYANKKGNKYKIKCLVLLENKKIVQRKFKGYISEIDSIKEPEIINFIKKMDYEALKFQNKIGGK